MYTFDPNPPFESGHSRARWAIVFLMASMALDAIATVSDLLEADLLGRMNRGSDFSVTEIADNDKRQEFVATIQLMVFVVTATLFLKWLYRAYRNLPALGADGLKFTPGWAVGWFFIPFLNLVRPFQAVRELWKASRPTDEASGLTEWRSNPTSPILGSWWAAWIGSNLLSTVAVRLSTREDLLEAYQTATWLTAFSNLISIAAATLLIAIIAKVETWQEEKAGASSIEFTVYRDN